MRNLLFFLFFLLLFSCTTHEKEKKTSSLFQPDTSQLVFSNYYFFDQSFKRLNFPHWFNRKQVRLLQIAQLKIENYNIIDSLKNDSIVFEFYESGAVKKIIHSYFDQEVLIRTDMVTYKNDSSLFQRFKIKHTGVLRQKKEMYDYFSFQEPIEKEDAYTVYRSHKPRIHPSEVYLLNEKQQNVSTIDQLPEDLSDAFFIYGPMQNPKKKFLQQELVQRDGEINYKYYPNGFLKSLYENHNNYFNQKQVKYDSTGRFKELLKQSRTKTDSTIINTQLYTVHYNSPVNEMLPSHFSQSIRISDSLKDDKTVARFQWSIYD
jgi:hypothetical protein